MNLDASQEGVSPDAVLPSVRRFLVEHNIGWPNLMNLPGARDFAKAYSVTEIPTNVLIGRDGKVVRLDVARGDLETVLTETLGR